MYNNFLELIKNESDEKYREFSLKITPNMGKSVGIRTPILKNFAKEVAKGHWQEFFEKRNNELYEEKLVSGFIICYIKENIDVRLNLLREFIPIIDNWAICDMVACAFKFKKAESEKVWDFVNEYIEKNGEFEKRFAVVMLLAHFIDEKHIDEILKMLNNIDDEKFYVSMAVAWALSVCYIKYREKTVNALKCTSLSSDTINRTVSKIKQSRRVDEEGKRQTELLKDIKEL